MVDNEMTELKRKDNPDQVIKPMDPEEITNHFYLLIVNSELPDFLAECEFIQNFSCLRSSSRNEHGFVMVFFLNAVEILKREITTKLNLTSTSLKIPNNEVDPPQLEDAKSRSSTLQSMTEKLTKRLGIRR